MGVVLEKMPITAAMARANISAVYRTAQVISSIPNKTYLSKAFPDGLFHHLLAAMSHPDHETRLIAHRVFCIVLIPTLSQSWSIHDLILWESGFPTMVPQKVEKSILETIDEEETKEKEGEDSVDAAAKSLSLSRENIEEDRKLARGSMRLNGHQQSLVLSSIWIQATTMENAPANFEAMAQTYTLALSFLLSKPSYHVALIRFFRLAFSLRSIALKLQGGPQPSRRRPVFMLASYMILVTANACQLPEIISIVKSTLTEETMDPCLLLDEDVKLQAVCKNPNDKNVYGSQTDDPSVMKSLSTLESQEKQLKDTLASHLVFNFGKSSQEDLSNMKTQLSQWFMPDEEYPLGAPLFVGTTHPSSPELQTFDEVAPHAESADEDGVDQHGDGKSSGSSNSVDFLSVNQLIESVEETSCEVVNTESSSKPPSYDEIKNHCEALVMGKQQKMSAVQNLVNHSQPKPNNEMEVNGVDHGQQEPFRLPTLSPYDKFLKPGR